MGVYMHIWYCVIHLADGQCVGILTKQKSAQEAGRFCRRWAKYCLGVDDPIIDVPFPIRTRALMEVFRRRQVDNVAQIGEIL